MTWILFRDVLEDLLESAIKNSKSKRFFIIADSCFGGNIMSPLWTDFAMKNTDRPVILITSSWIGSFLHSCWS